MKRTLVLNKHPCFQVNVHVTLSHGEQFSYVHSPSALWVQSVTTRGFEACIRESGIPSNGSGIINWLAFEDRPDITHGSVSFNGFWTTETKCEKISFSQVRSYMQSAYPFTFEFEDVCIPQLADNTFAS